MNWKDNLRKNLGIDREVHLSVDGFMNVLDIYLSKEEYEEQMTHGTFSIAIDLIGDKLIYCTAEVKRIEYSEK